MFSAPGVSTAAMYCYLEIEREGLQNLGGRRLSCTLWLPLGRPGGVASHKAEGEKKILERNIFFFAFSLAVGHPPGLLTCPLRTIRWLCDGGLRI